MNSESETPNTEISDLEAKEGARAALAGEAPIKLAAMFFSYTYRCG